jgi:hypothetical protein
MKWIFGIGRWNRGLLCPLHALACSTSRNGAPKQTNKQTNKQNKKLNQKSSGYYLDPNKRPWREYLIFHFVLKSY